MLLDAVAVFESEDVFVTGGGFGVTGTGAGGDRDRRDRVG